MKKISFKDFLIESDKFMDVQTSYLKSEEEKETDPKSGKKKIKKNVLIFDPKKWREYLQYVKSVQ